MSVEWGSPIWLWALPLIPALLYLVSKRRRGSIAYPRTAALGGAGGPRLWLARAPDVLRALALAALVLALARPRTAGEPIEEGGQGVPIVIALDISSSMLAEDFRPRNRLTVAKQNIARFVATRESDPVGLVAFAAEAITVVPITSHDPILVNALRTLQVGLLEDGTAIGEGLAIAVNRLRDVPAPSKVVILMSDGVSNRGDIDPADAAQAAAALGIQVFTIGVGSRSVARVPVAAAGGGIRYAQLPVEIDEGLMTEIAEVTGGRYFRATDPQALADVYSQIDRLVKAPLESRRRVPYADWYLAFLATASALLAAEWLLRGSRWGVVPG